MVITRYVAIGSFALALAGCGEGVEEPDWFAECEQVKQGEGLDHGTVTMSGIIDGSSFELASTSTGHAQQHGCLAPSYDLLAQHMPYLDDTGLSSVKLVFSIDADMNTSRAPHVVVTRYEIDDSYHFYDNSERTFTIEVAEREEWSVSGEFAGTAGPTGGTPGLTIEGTFQADTRYFQQGRD